MLLFSGTRVEERRYRKNDDRYLEFGFTSTEINGEEKPQKQNKISVCFQVNWYAFKNLIRTAWLANYVFFFVEET